MKKISLLILVLFINFCSPGQIANYKDVGVIINQNSPVSIQIGEYFKQVRNIPEQNMIYIETVTDEVIDTIELKRIIRQVRDDIYQKGLENILNYLVTTKGVPFDVAVESCSIGYPYSTWQMCSSLESELTLLLSADSIKIGQNSFTANPYYGSDQHIAAANTDILLVSRLDGKNADEVYKLIDRSGPGAYMNKKLAKFIFDISYVPDTNILFKLWSQRMLPAMDTLSERGWKTLFHGDTLLPAAQDDVAGYVSLCRKMITSPLDFGWQNGSFAELIIPSLNFTFYDSLNFLNEMQLSGMMQDGCGSGGAYLHASLASKITDYTIFFSRYTDESDTAYNLAESYYMANQTLSWTNILVGDPKTTITTIGSGGVADVSNPFVLNIFPNPASTFVNLSIISNTPTNITILVLDQPGKVHFTESHQVNIGRNHISLNIAELNRGFYFARIVNEVSGKSFTKKLLVR